MKAVIVGLGKSGLAAVQYLHSLGLQTAASEYKKQITAEEQAVLAACGAAVELGGHTPEFFAAAELIVVSPGVPTNLPVLNAARSRGVPVVGELALAAGRIPVPVIAVTGSNGKTTVTSLIGQLLRSSGKKTFVGGNIGTPVLDWLREPDDAEAAVLELSSFQLDMAGEFRPDIALLLNLSPDHIDRHGSFENYAEAKRQIFARQGRADIAILGADDPLVAAKPVTTAGSVLHFGTQLGCRAKIEGQQVRLEPGFGVDGAAEFYDLSATRLSSLVNAYNAAAAILAARAFGCSVEGIKAGLAAYQPPLHRMTPAGEIKGVRFINDSKATNIGAVQAALAGFKKDVILIAGGRNKGGDFNELIPVFQQHVKQVVLIGEAGLDLAAAAEAAGIGHQFADDMGDAVRKSFAAAKPGETVLLAPACASFDMFKNYEHRGDEFMRCAAELALIHHTARRFPFNLKGGSNGHL
ncbi:UDP-N-acetylmuramoyl-L-alanine--D-glutamate ligase [Candidatus Electronema sp. JC]|uniref:UDP-N-acetylmuramoyl-L-alanine--D-glutamate ligase n=1 Tax=Candidatus Electronema sp. JC TaxID=3401570 RepID=UPI003B42F3F3